MPTWMKLSPYGPKSILVVNFSHMILFSSIDQFDIRVEFHSYSHITPLDFTHVKTFMHDKAIKIIIFIHNGRMSINVVKVSFMILLNFCCTIYRFDFTCAQFHPCWKSHPCHEIYPIYHFSQKFVKYHF
jgi:hypothetical protein